MWTLARKKYKTNSIAVHFIVMGLLRVLSLACLCQSYALVNGHGNIVKPMAWWDENQAGWHWDEDGIDTGLGCGVLDMPTNTEFHDETGKDPDCKQYWLSHNAEIPGEATIPEEMSQPEVTCINQAGHRNDTWKTFPWQAPGV